LAAWFRNADPAIYAILAVSIWVLGVVIERFIFLFFKYNINASAFMGQIQKLVIAGNIDRAIKMCNAAPSAALPRVVKAGLTRANKGQIAIGNAIEEAQLEIVPNITKRTQSLLSLANIATLLGLLGTIHGLIVAFGGLADAAPEDRQKILSAGIALAMRATAFGLSVAIVAMFAHLGLSAISKKIIEELDQYAVKVENLLVAYGKGKLGADEG
jgi:biopolymer transport protein ExbB/TolQ